MFMTHFNRQVDFSILFFALIVMASCSTDPTRPSFFEMIAQSQLMPLFDPAFKYIFTVGVLCFTQSNRSTDVIFQVLAQRYVSCEWVVRYHDEIFSAARFIIERHYLQHYGTTMH